MEGERVLCIVLFVLVAVASRAHSSLSLGSFENGITEMATSLALNSSLTSLDLRNNNIGPNGGGMLARGLRDNRTLVSLDLRWNEIGNPGALAFKDLFVTGMNTVLKSVKLVGNKVSDVILTQVEDLMARGRGLGAMVEAGGGSMEDEFHVVKGKNEELQKELAKMSAELQAAKDENRTKDSEYEIINAKSKVRVLGGGARSERRGLDRGTKDGAKDEALRIPRHRSNAMNSPASLVASFVRRRARRL